MKILVKKDGGGYLARVQGSTNLFAYGLTKDQALEELSGVVDMTMDYHLEQALTFSSPTAQIPFRFRIMPVKTFHRASSGRFSNC